MTTSPSERRYNVTIVIEDGDDVTHRELSSVTLREFADVAKQWETATHKLLSITAISVGKKEENVGSRYGGTPTALQPKRSGH